MEVPVGEARFVHIRRVAVIALLVRAKENVIGWILGVCEISRLLIGCGRGHHDVRGQEMKHNEKSACVKDTTIEVCANNKSPGQFSPQFQRCGTLSFPELAAAEPAEPCCQQEELQSPVFCHFAQVGT